MIVLEKQMRSGVVPKYHVATSVTLTPNGQRASVQSYCHDDMQVISWHGDYPVPAGVAIATLADVEQALMAPGGPFEGGYLADPNASNLLRLKAVKWGEVKQRCDAWVAGGCLVLGESYRIDTDAGSIAAINTAALAAKAALDAGQAWADAWTMADDQVVPVTAAEMIEIQQDVAAFVSACHARRRALRMQIDAATAPEAVTAIDVLGGWPD